MSCSIPSHLNATSETGMDTRCPGSLMDVSWIQEASDIQQLGLLHLWLAAVAMQAVLVLS